MEKERKSNRKPLKVYLNVFDEKTGELFGYIVDITKAGFMLTRETPVSTGESFRLKLELPAKVEESGAISFTAISMWNEKDEETDFYNTGFQFSEISEDDEKIIATVIEKLCFIA